MKIIKRISILICSLCSVGLSYTAIVPDSNSLAAAEVLAVETVSSFLTETLECRLKFAYFQAFTDNDHKERLRNAAENASKKLADIFKTQREFQNVIENYPASDWQSRFGATGLWNKIQSDIANTVILKGRVDYYLGLTMAQEGKKRFAEKIIKSIDAEPLLAKADQAALIRASAYSLRGEKKTVVRLIDEINRPGESYFDAAILKLEIADANLAKVKKVYDELKKSNSGENFEFNARLAFLQLRAGADDIFCKLAERYPASRDVLVSCILRRLKDKPETLRCAEAKIVARFALADPMGQYNGAILKAAEFPHLRSGELLYTAGWAAFQAESNSAIDYLLAASRMESPHSKAAVADATKIAWEYFNRGKISCALALSVFEEYLQKSLPGPDERLYYAYSILLRKCGRAEEAVGVLKKISAEIENEFSCQAEYELIIERFQNDCNNALAIDSLTGFIKRCPGKTAQVHALAWSRISEIIMNLDEMACDQLLIKRSAALAGMIAGSNKRIKLAAIELACLVEDINSVQISKLQSDFNEIKPAYDPNDPDLLRCEGRVLIAAGDFDKAYLVWTRIVNSYGTSSSAAERSVIWWPGKYFQLLSLAKSALPQSAKSAHAAEVLLNSYDDIPAFWREKLLVIAESP